MTRCRFLFSKLSAAVMLAAALVFAGCVSEYPKSRAYFQDAAINHQPAKLVLDTGSGITTLMDAGAKKLGVKTAQTAPDVAVNGQSNGPVQLALSEPVPVRVGHETFTGQVPILAFAWYIRWFSDWMDTDALVGWPEVRDNVLVFDGEQHTIRTGAVPPPDAPGWVRLGVRPNDQLTLETTLADGSTGVILVDTGSPLGVSLSPARWKAWQAGHPQAPSATRYFSLPNSDGGSTEEAWADEITIGTLTLKDVPVHEADKVESGDLRNYSGTLGLYALSRMDLIVDAKNRTAYARPKPPPGAPYPGIDRPGVQKFSADAKESPENWAVADNVPLSAKRLFTGAARIKMETGDIKGAIADCDRALADDPNNADAYVIRGHAHAVQNDFSSALADYSRAIELDPDNTEALVERGWAKFKTGDIQGALADDNEVLHQHPSYGHALYNRALVEQKQRNYAAAVADFSRFIQLNPNNAWAVNDRGWTKLSQGDYAGAVHDFNLMRERNPKEYGFAVNLGAAKQNAGDFAGAIDAYDKAIKLKPGDSQYSRLYRQFLLLRLGKSPGNFAREVANWDPGWGKTAGQFVAGRLSEADFLAAAAQGDEKTVRGRQCEADYFAGVLRLINGDAAGARAWWEKCLANGPEDYYEYQFARADLARLDAAAAK